MSQRVTKNINQRSPEQLRSHVRSLLRGLNMNSPDFNDDEEYALQIGKQLHSSRQKLADDPADLADNVVNAVQTMSEEQVIASLRTLICVAKYAADIPNNIGLSRDEAYEHWKVHVSAPFQTLASSGQYPFAKVLLEGIANAKIGSTSK